MRTIWPRDEALELHGEFDKSGSQLFSGTIIKGVKPDFLVHLPGNLEKNGNFAAIEIKSSNVRNADIAKDLHKLSTILSKTQYKIGIYLIYGYEAKTKAKLASEMLKSNQENIEIWVHLKPNSRAKLFERSGGCASNPDRSCSIV